jgi:putative glycosyltransferase (TIGR04372 family)
MLRQIRKGTTIRILSKLYFHAFRLGVTFLNFVFSGKYELATNTQITTLRYSGVFENRSGFELLRIYRDWEFSETLWNQGRYHQAVKVQKDCLEYIYSQQKLDGLNQVPPFLSVGWGAAIGHIGCLGAYSIAQQSGIISSLKRTLPVTKNPYQPMISNLFSDQFNLAPAVNGFSILEHPMHWALSERLPIIRTSNGFMSLYDLIERVFSTVKVDKSNQHFKLDTTFEHESSEMLMKLGLPQDAWFVGLHIRENENVDDPRNVTVSKFHSTVEEIVKSGGWVIRFGAGKMSPLPQMSNVIDLNSNEFRLRKLHLYILKNARFIVCTNSGPAALAWALGTPVLQTDTIAIGRNILSSSRGSIFLPKIWVKAGRKCSMNELLSSSEGYSETNLHEKNLQGFTLHENSETDLRNATIDMIRQAGLVSTKSNLDLMLDDVRKANGAIGYGKIAPSFLDEHQKWLLS